MFHPSLFEVGVPRQAKKPAAVSWPVNDKCRFLLVMLFNIKAPFYDSVITADLISPCTSIPLWIDCNSKGTKHGSLTAHDPTGIVRKQGDKIMRKRHPHATGRRSYLNLLQVFSHSLFLSKVVSLFYARNF